MQKVIILREKHVTMKSFTSPFFKKSFTSPFFNHLSLNRKTTCGNVIEKENKDIHNLPGNLLHIRI